MRAILGVAAALAVLTVSGCDINSGPAKTAKVDCNCTAPPQAATTPPPDMRGAYAPPTVHYRWRGHAHRYAGGGHSYYWRREFAEISVATYDYHSDSHSYYQGYQGTAGGSDASAYAGGGAHGDDGYRRVDGGATAGEPAYYETHGDDRARLHPWHGYDADCPDQDPDRHRH